MDKIFK